MKPGSGLCFTLWALPFVPCCQATMSRSWGRGDEVRVSRGQWGNGGSSPHPTTSPGVDQLPPAPWALCSIRGDLRSHKNTTPHASGMSQGPSKERSGTFYSPQDKRVDFHPGGFSVYSMKTACNKGMGPTSDGGSSEPPEKEIEDGQKHSFFTAHNMGPPDVLWYRSRPQLADLSQYSRGKRWW